MNNIDSITESNLEQKLDGIRKLFKIVTHMPRYTYIRIHAIFTEIMICSTIPY